MNRATWFAYWGFVLAALSLPAAKADDEPPGSIAGSFVFPEGIEREAFDYRLQISPYSEPKAIPSSVILKPIQVVSVDANGWGFCHARCAASCGDHIHRLSP